MVESLHSVEDHAVQFSVTQLPQACICSCLAALSAAEGSMYPSVLKLSTESGPIGGWVYLCLAPLGCVTALVLFLLPSSVHHVSAEEGTYPALRFPPELVLHARNAGRCSDTRGPVRKSCRCDLIDPLTGTCLSIGCLSNLEYTCSTNKALLSFRETSRPSPKFPVVLLA